MTHQQVDFRSEVDLLALLPEAQRSRNASPDDTPSTGVEKDLLVDPTTPITIGMHEQVECPRWADRSLTFHLPRME